MFVLITADKHRVFFRWLVLSSFRPSRSSLKIFTALTILRDELLKELVGTVVLPFQQELDEDIHSVDNPQG
jgi:hypothetical protein